MWPSRDRGNRHRAYRGSLGAGTPRRVWLGLAAVLIVFAVLASIVAVKTPPWEAADEPGHVQNIETLVSGHWFTIPSSCSLKPGIGPLFDCAGSEPQQAPLYYLVLAGWQKVAGVPAQLPYRGRNDLERYFSPDGPVLMDDHSANSGFIRWLRFPNIVLGLLTLLVSFFAVQRVTKDPWSPLVAAAILASIPRLIFLSAFVTNDNMVILLGACLTYVSLRFALSPTRLWMAAVGVVFGLLVTTKLSVLPMGLVVIVLACLVAGWRRRVELMAIGYGSALAISSWYLIQNTVRYGDPLALAASSKYLRKIVGLGTLHDRPYVVNHPLELVFVQVPQRVVDSIWYQSGWGQFQWSEALNWVITGVVVCVVAGVIGRRYRRGVLITLGTVVVTALLCVWVTAFETATYQARYAYGGAMAIAGLLALGLER